MMPTITAQDTLREVVFKVCTALHQTGIQAVLTGGAAAAFYAPEAAQSRDADFIASWYSLQREFDETMRLLGYIKSGRIYRHPTSLFTLDFPDEEIRIGQSYIKEFDTIREGDLMLHILSPLHVVCDRLASFYWFDDRSALKAAVAVAKLQHVALWEVEEWSKKHGELDKYQEFAMRCEL